ncbi:MAG TPA: ROK family protein [Pyrinomonadaceae bacterium]|jgi:predicted NBD/HSP70 family sugar kinase|nr:ROK family protein [Pyrinomonadaceae bacterium]
MRKINTRDFRVATRSTSREINRRIALNVIHEHQPISRAEVARRMNVTRGVAGVLVQELLDQDLIYEGATGEAAFGRKPTLLHIKSHDRLVVAVDIRFSKTYVMVCDFSGRQVALETCDTKFTIPELIRDLGERIRRLIKTTGSAAGVEGVGVAVPGMVDQRSGKILNAPALGWRDVELRKPLATVTGLPVEIENSGRACTLAHLWLERGEPLRPQNFVYVGVSDGVGVGVVVNGELLRGADYIAGEFAHVPLNIEGPRCRCGSSGCWEAYISNLATLSRYFGWDLSKLRPNKLRDAKQGAFTVADLIARARGGDKKATSAIQSTARFLGLGLGTIVNVINPECIYLDGEITTAWDLIESTVTQAESERALTEKGGRTPLRIATNTEHSRLRGAAALIAAPTFAAPRVA